MTMALSLPSSTMTTLSPTPGSHRGGPAPWGRGPRFTATLLLVSCVAIGVMLLCSAVSLALRAGSRMAAPLRRRAPTRARRGR